MKLNETINFTCNASDVHLFSSKPKSYKICQTILKCKLFSIYENKSFRLIYYFRKRKKIDKYIHPMLNYRENVLCGISNPTSFFFFLFFGFPQEVKLWYNKQNSQQMRTLQHSAWNLFIKWLLPFIAQQYRSNFIHFIRYSCIPVPYYLHLIM